MRATPPWLRLPLPVMTDSWGRHKPCCHSNRKQEVYYTNAKIKTVIKIKKKKEKNPADVTHIMKLFLVSREPTRLRGSECQRVFHSPTVFLVRICCKWCRASLTCSPCRSRTFWGRSVELTRSNICTAARWFASFIFCPCKWPCRRTRTHTHTKCDQFFFYTVCVSAEQCVSATVLLLMLHLKC